MSGSVGQSASVPKNELMRLNELKQKQAYKGNVLVKLDKKEGTEYEDYKYFLAGLFFVSVKELVDHPAFSTPVGVEATVDEPWIAKFEYHRNALPELHALHDNPPAPIFLDLEFGRGSRELALVQLAGRGGPAHLLDTVAVPRLVELLESVLLHDATERVVLHGGEQDALVLASYNISGLRVFDTQVAHEILTGRVENNLRDTVKVYHGLVPNKDPQMLEFMENNQWLLAPRPLPQFALQYAAQDVLCLERMYNAMLDKLTPEQLELTLQLSVDKKALRDWRNTRAKEKMRASRASAATAGVI
jgi:hypothetical protein